MKKPLTVSVEHFYTQHAARLQLKLVAGQEGMGRLIREGAVNRLGMALTGFIKYFAYRRVQLIGQKDSLHRVQPRQPASGDHSKGSSEGKGACFYFPDSDAPAGESDHAMFGGGFCALDQ